MPRKGPKAFEKFIEALVKQGQDHIAEKLDLELTYKYQAAGNECIVVIVLSIYDLIAHLRDYLICTCAKCIKPALSEPQKIYKSDSGLNMAYENIERTVANGAKHQSDV